MQYREKNLFGIIVVLVTVSSESTWGLEADVTTKQDPAKAELIALGERYKCLAEEWSRILPADGAEESDVDISDESWLRQFRQRESQFPSPDSQLLSSFLELANRHPDSPFALDALVFAIRCGGYSSIDVQSESWKLKERAIDLVLAGHMEDPRVVALLDLISRSLPSKTSEAFLRRAVVQGRNRTTRAAACLCLAQYLRTVGRVHKHSEVFAEKERPKNFERFWKIVVTPYLESEIPFNPNRVAAEAEELLARVKDEFSDVPAVQWKLAGPSHVFFNTEPYATPKTYGDLAQTMLFEMKHLVPGAKVPDIEGADAEGKSFRLSGYRGKVVLLTFSANWCAGCVELYPLQRKLVTRFRDEPFALLSVSCDDSIDTLKADVNAGIITWRCWWDGRNGPIHAAWNSPGFPTIFLLDDKQVIQDVGLTKLSTPDEFESAILQLLIRARRTGDQ